MIDIATETVIGFKQAADIAPRTRRGKKIHVSTFYRWTVKGCRGVRLEYIQIGGTRATSAEALQRFFDRLTEGSQSQEPARPLRSMIQRQKRSDAAARELEKLGC